MPFFTVNFKGSIGIREVWVRDTELDAKRTFSSTQRALDFGNSSEGGGFATAQPAPPTSGSCGGAAASSMPPRVVAAGATSMYNGHQATMYPEVLNLSDEEDGDWQPTYHDFDDSEASGTPDHLNSEFDENPLLELGLYDQEEDTTGWRFEDI
jgi:hypothetical protein